MAARKARLKLKFQVRPFGWLEANVADFGARQKLAKSSPKTRQKLKKTQKKLKKTQKKLKKTPALKLKTLLRGKAQRELNNLSRAFFGSREDA